tara:strand:- start:511 stop:699 length:189 start_codon:yes stop_codon:yes gene_type:complete
MEGKKLNVTEEWLQVITQIALSYQRKQSETVNIKDQEKNIEVVEIVVPTINSNEINPKNLIF